MTARRTFSAGRVWSVTALAGALGATAPAAPEPAAEPPTAVERTGLTRLHRQAVMLFIDREGFGFSRLGPPPLEDVLGPPKSAADGRTGPAAPTVARSDRDKKAPHFSIAKALQAGVFVPPPAAGKAWVVKEVRLVGLTKNPDPVVYLDGGPADGAAADGTKREVKTRKPDEFETKAVEVIRGGGELVQAEKRGGVLRAVSGIYAGRRCAGCHERPGEMLGAFSYRLAAEDVKAAGAAGTVRP